MKRNTVLRVFIYILGLLILALGLTLNTKAALGVSPLISLPYSVSVIKNYNLGNLVFLWYIVFVLAEIVIHLLMGKTGLAKRLISDILQLPLSLVLSRLINIFSRWIPEFETVYRGSFWGSVYGRILVLIAAVIITGIGVALSLRMNIVPNPGDGVVQSLAEAFNLKLGIAKNLFDIGCVILTVAVSLLLGGKIVGVGIGTIIAMLLTGRVIGFANKYLLSRLEKLIE